MLPGETETPRVRGSAVPPATHLVAGGALRGHTAFSPAGVQPVQVSWAVGGAAALPTLTADSCTHSSVSALPAPRDVCHRLGPSTLAVVPQAQLCLHSWK